MWRRSERRGSARRGIADGLRGPLLPALLLAGIPVLAWPGRAPAQARVQVQEPAQPVFELVSDEASLVFPLQALLGGEPRDRDRPGTHRLTLGPGGVPEVTAAEPLAPGIRFELSARPGEWLRHAAQPVAGFVASTAPRLELLAQMAGLPAGQGRALLEGAVAVAAQVEQLALVATRPGRERGTGASSADATDLYLRLCARTGSPLAGWIGRLRPGPPRAPLPAAADAALRLSLAVPADELPALAGPFLALAVALDGANSNRGKGQDDATGENAAGGEGAAARAGLADVVGLDELDELAGLVRALECLDGTCAVVLDGRGARLCVGLRDAESWARLQTSAPAVERKRVRLERQRIDGEITPAAFEHRGITALGTVLWPDRALPGLAAGDGAVRAFSAVAGDVWLSLVGGTGPEESMKAAIDGVLDGRLFAFAAAGDARRPVLTLDLDLAGLQALLTRRGPPPSAPAGVGRVRVAVSRDGDHLEARIQLR